MWYDWFAAVYDPAIERVYRPYRAHVVDALRLDATARVLDLACGTGQNLPHLAPHAAAVVGVDLSTGMLARARKRIAAAGWSNVSVVEADARNLTAEQLGGPIHRVCCTLGLSTIPDFEGVVAATFDMLEPGGRYVIFDVHAERWVPQTTWVQLLARADLSRKVWEPLEAVATDFELTWLDGSPHVHGGRCFVASGVKA